jgi:hypothetical protein
VREGGTGRGRRQGTKITGVTKITTYFLDTENVKRKKKDHIKADIHRKIFTAVTVAA